MTSAERIAKVIVQRLSDLVLTDQEKFNMICDLLGIDDRQPFVNQAFSKLIAERIEVTIFEIFCGLSDVIDNLPSEFTITTRFAHPQGTMSILVDTTPKIRIQPKAIDRTLR